MLLVEIKELQKRYDNLIAVDNLNIEIEKGEIYGLVGPNGSGKTSTINSMLSIINYDRGKIKIFGEEMPSESDKIKKKIGYVPQEISVFKDLNVYENIDFFCGLYISDKKVRKKYVNEAIEFVGLENYKKFIPKKLSGGLLRRLNLACGIAHKPELIIFDEPTVAVDPQSRNFILEGIKKMNEEGATILYTSHYMEEVEMLCKKISIMDKGKILITGSKDELKKAVGLSDMLIIKNISVSKDDIENIRKIDGVLNISLEGEELIIAISKGITVSHCLTYLENSGIFFSNIEVKSPNLNDVFLEITGKKLRDI